MPSHCCVPFCNANYPSGPRVSVFSFPRDVELLKKWIIAIPRKNFVPSPNTKVCQKHFKLEDIVTETSAFDAKNKVTITVPLKNHRLKADAVPSIFENYPVKQKKQIKKPSLKEKQEKDNSESSAGTSMQKKNPKNVISSASDANTSIKSGKHDDEKKGSVKSPKKGSPTTDRPIIAVIKAEDLIMEDEDSVENIEDSDHGSTEKSTSGSKSFSLPSPYKNLPSVSVCLKEEDRVPFTRELKGVKRSPSTGSNSSTGSSDAQKSNVIIKKRKIERPAPVVIGRQNDCYCWVCHRENITCMCIACPRAYHTKCAGEVIAYYSDWVCPECKRILAAENVDTRSLTLSEISLEKLGTLLKLSLNKMKQRAPIAFHQPVSLEHYPLYLHYVIHPMDFSLLEKNIKQKLYGSTEAFLADVKWIAHNSCVFNGTQHPLSTNAKNLVKSCDQDMSEIEVCPDCFVHSVVRNKYWFSEVCRKPHPLVWAKLKGFPYWPAKVVRIADGNVDARFFGAHDRAWVPMSQCYHLSKEMPTTSKPKKKGNYEVALDELNVHVHLLIQKFGCFEYAPYRTSFNSEDKTLMYHGIDIDKVSKEDISIDNSATIPEMKLGNSEKENRFASFMESEYERLNSDAAKLSNNPPEIQSSESSKTEEIRFPPSFFKHRESTDSVTSEKVISVDEKSADKPNNTSEVEKNEASQNSTSKRTGNISDSDQLRKLELALERIKGYVSLNVDEKENTEVQSEEDEKETSKKEEVQKSDEKEKKDENSNPSKASSPLFKEDISLPIIESNSAVEDHEDVSVVLEATKKTDSFFLKLNETIESCKAKLGISEINDDLSSDDSGGDDNGSKSDEDEEDDTSASGAEEASDEDDEEGEVMELSDEELENGDGESKLDNEESEYEDSEEQDSQSSDTDIEYSNEMSPKKVGKLVQNEDNMKQHKKMTDEDDEVSSANENSVKDLSSDSNEAIIANPDMQVPEIIIDNTASLDASGEVVDEAKRSSNDKEQAKELENCKTVSPQKMDTDSKDQYHPILSSDDESLNADSTKTLSSNLNNDNLCKNIENRSTPVKKSSSSKNICEKMEDIKPNIHKSNLEDGEEEVEDDEIFICTPTKPKSPPVIVLDDDQEIENSSASDTFALKTPPYSTSIASMESFSTEDRAIADDGDEGDQASEKTLSVNHRMSSELEIDDKEKYASNENENLSLRSPGESRKRKLSVDSSSGDDDDVQIVTATSIPARTGAIRTFNKPSNKGPTLQPPTPTMESVKRNLEKESLNQINQSTPTDEINSMQGSPPDQILKDSISPPPSSENYIKPRFIDASNLSDKDKEIIFLKKKLNCVLTAYKIQSWKCAQERDELRHNMNLIIMEMRACLESDKKQAIESLSQKLEEEKFKCIEDAKRKQWCANCLNESRYACCWNTSYCSVDCQKRHFPEHRASCTQMKNKNVEIIKTKSVIPNATETNENKKFFIFNMKSPDNIQQVSQVSVNKPTIHVVPKNPPQTVTTATSSSSNIQFVLAPVKSTATESAVVTPTTSITSLQPKEQNLDSAQIINQVRNKSCDLGTAIKFLQKKNQESSLSLMNNKDEDTPKEETNLEEIYFPSPPKVTFEDYDTAIPDPTIHLESEVGKDDSETQDADTLTDLSPEPDLVLSDTDEMDNEMVCIGHGIEVKAKFLNKCLVYGQTGKKLARCLVDVLFPDLKLLAACSAFGQKSNVTKLTRAALPSRKVLAIIDFVRKRFPETTRSEIVLAINMKCKEARLILSRKEGDLPKKVMVRRLLAREKEDELVTAVTTVTTATTTVSVAAPRPIVPVSSPVFISSNSAKTASLVCVKSTNQSVLPLPFNLSPRMPTGPNILRCNSPILIKPKPGAVVNTVGKASILQTAPRKRETVKNLLAANKMRNLPNDGSKLVMAVDKAKPVASTAQPVPLPTSSTAAANVRPLIIIGSQVTTVKAPSTPVQSPSQPFPSNMK